MICSRHNPPASPKRILGICWIGLLFVFSACATSPEAELEQSSRARQKLREGIEFGSLNMRREMIASFKEAVKLDPKEPRYRVHLGTAYFMVGQLQKAEEQFKKSLELDADYKDAYRQLGRLYMQKGEWAKAARNFEEDLSRPGTPLPHRVYNWLALCYYNQEKFDRAEAEWKNALEIRDNAGIRLNLGLAYRDRERFDLAMQSFRRAVELNPGFPQAHYEMALLLVKEKKLDEAAIHFKEVTRLAPKSQWARASRKYLELIRGDE